MPKPKPKAEDDVSAMNSLRRLIQVLRGTNLELETRLKISGAQLFVLQQLGAHPRSTVGQLAALTSTDQSSVSVVVSRLVRQRLVTRRTSARDARCLELELTKAGRALLAHAPETPQGRMVRALRDLSLQRTRSLARGLSALVHAVGADGTAPEMFFEKHAPKRKRKGS